MERECLQSLTTNLTAYYQAMFSDIAWLYRRPSELKKDLSRFSHELGVNGSRFATIDLPALGKHFDKCLDQGLYLPTNLPYGRRGKQEKVPVLLRDLLLQVFDTEGKLRPKPSIDAIVALRLVYTSAKKIRLQCKESRVLSELQNYERIEHETRKPDLRWSDDVLDSGSDRAKRLSFQDQLRCEFELPGGGTVFLPVDWVFTQETGREHGVTSQDLLMSTCMPLWHATEMLDRVSDIVSSALGDFQAEAAGELPKHGPGVTAEQGRWDDKFQFPNWPSKLDNTFPYDLYGSPNLGEHARTYGGHYPGSAEKPSRIIAVPKTQKAPRLIAAEPTAHQWIQQLIWNQLETRLHATPVGGAIHFRDQRHNQEAARKGSIDGCYATVDLSSASDRLSCWAVERAFRTNPTLLNALHACRTRWTTYRYGNEQRYMLLNKFAPMGSAVTFPVQTIIYACVAVAAVLVEEGRHPSRVTSAMITRVARQISVFGDDIVIPSDAVDVLTVLLTHLGLRVNVDKTYSRGLFRESCGSEWWNGHDVSIPYLVNVPVRSTLSTLTSRLEERNNFYERGYWATARWLGTWIRDQSRIPSAQLGTDEPGLLSVTRKSRRLRFSKRFHRFEEYCLVPRIRDKTVPRAGWSSLMMWLLGAARRDANRLEAANRRAAQAAVSTVDPVLSVTGSTPVPVFSRLALVKASASIWKLGWHPCYQIPQYSIVEPAKRP